MSRPPAPGRLFTAAVAVLVVIGLLAVVAVVVATIVVVAFVSCVAAVVPTSRLTARRVTTRELARARNDHPRPLPEPRRANPGRPS